MKQETKQTAVGSNSVEDETLRALDIIKDEIQRYVDVTWKHGRELVVSDWNQITPVIQYTVDDIKRNYQRLKDSNAQLLKQIECESQYSSLLKDENDKLKDSNRELIEALESVLAFEKRGADKGAPRIGNGILSIVNSALKKAKQQQ